MTKPIYNHFHFPPSRPVPVTTVVDYNFVMLFMQQITATHPKATESNLHFNVTLKNSARFLPWRWCFFCMDNCIQREKATGKRERNGRRSLCPYKCSKSFAEGRADLSRCFKINANRSRLHNRMLPNGQTVSCFILRQRWRPRRRRRWRRWRRRRRHGRWRCLSTQSCSITAASRLPGPSSGPAQEKEFFFCFLPVA